MTAASYPLLDAFWTILLFFALLMWIWLIVACITDLFRSHDLSGWSKALWMLAIIVIPLVGVFGYLIVRGTTMHERQAQQVNAYEASLRNAQGPQSVDGAAGVADQLAKLADLKDRGVLSEQEFQQEKSRVLAA
jgi:hypothetical protein